MELRNRWKKINLECLLISRVKGRIFKDPAQVYVGKVARHNQKMTNQFFKQKPLLFRGACRRVLEVPREGANQEKHVGKKRMAGLQARTGPAQLSWNTGTRVYSEADGSSLRSPAPADFLIARGTGAPAAWLTGPDRISSSERTGPGELARVSECDRRAGSPQPVIVLASWSCSPRAT